MSKITKCAAYYIFAPVVTYVICLVASNEMLGLVHTVPNRHKQKHDPDMRTKEVRKLPIRHIMELLIGNLRSETSNNIIKLINDFNVKKKNPRKEFRVQEGRLSWVG